MRLRKQLEITTLAIANSVGGPPEILGQDILLGVAIQRDSDIHVPAVGLASAGKLRK